MAQGSSSFDRKFEIIPTRARGIIAPAAHSRGTMPRLGWAQPRCSPPSSAIICPVIAGADRMKRMASQISCGEVGRRSGTASHCLAKCSSLWRSLFSVGPGPIPLTRIFGASA